MNLQLPHNVNFHFYTKPASAVSRPAPGGHLLGGIRTCLRPGMLLFYPNVTLLYRLHSQSHYNCVETPNALTLGIPMFTPVAEGLVKMLVPSFQMPLMWGSFPQGVSHVLCWGPGLRANRLYSPISVWIPQAVKKQGLLDIIYHHIASASSGVWSHIYGLCGKHM